jgi:hypothetical protein
MGRAEKYIYLNDGSKVPFHNALAGIHGAAWGLAEKLQCIQKEPGQLDVHLIPSSAIEPEKAMEGFKAQIGQRISKEKLTVNAKIVDHIPTTKSGKAKFFVKMMKAI